MADDRSRDDYGGTGHRYGGSSSGGYGTGGAAADVEDVVGHGPLSARDAFRRDFRGRGPTSRRAPSATGPRTSRKPVSGVRHVCNDLRVRYR